MKVQRHQNEINNNFFSLFLIVYIMSCFNILNTVILSHIHIGLGFMGGGGTNVHIYYTTIMYSKAPLNAMDTF